MKLRKNDYLKYFRIVKDYYRHKYKIDGVLIDTMLFLYSEQSFTRAEFTAYSTIVGGFSEYRLKCMIRDGWIVKTNMRKAGYGGRQAIAVYTLSMKGVRLCTGIYSKLNGDELVDFRGVVMTKHKGSLRDKALREMMFKMNEETLQLRRQPHE